MRLVVVVVAAGAKEPVADGLKTVGAAKLGSRQRTTQKPNDE